MRERGVSGYALSEATKIPQPTIHRILKGESQDPKTKTLEPIARYFGLTVSAMRDDKTPENLPKQVGNELCSPPNTSFGVNLSPDLIQIIKWYQAMGPRNRARAMAQIHLWYLDDTQEDGRPSVPGARVISQGEALEPNQKGHHKSDRKTVK